MAETTPQESSLSACASFRRFIQDLQAENDLVAIDEEVDPDLELAAITRKVYETEDKAPLFNHLKGRHPSGLFRVLGAPVGASKQPGKRFIRIAKSLGLPSTASGQEIVHKFRAAKHLPQIPPTEVPTGPVKEFKLLGDEIDLTALPVPKLHADDGGKFLQTFGMYIVQSPDGSWVNWSITRSMLHGKRTLVGPMIPRQDIGVIRQMWADLGQDCPFALCFGVPPAAIMVSGMPLPKGVNESEYIGALIGRPVEVTKAETNDILVPANAEIVFEGSISRTETAPEGPMAEYPGLIFPGEQKECPLHKIDAITYRRDPILPICVTGRAPEESETVWGLTQAAEVLTICEQAGLPITMVWNPFESHCLWFVLQVDRAQLRARHTTMEAFCREVGHTVFASKPGYYIPIVYLVGDDIDPTNLRDVIWANATRCQPRENEYFFDQYPNIGLIPYVSHGAKSGANHLKVVRCCMFASEFSEVPTYKEASYRGNYPQEIQDKVDAKWATYGF
ncbi:putative 3-octaprenyl-4-hydroxybenzoate carboxy-lyase [Aspergillus uvarum CBS 121591]|uniref:Ferulic acid decarboxylase 1 n=1 Tax=Aspergillus uvarum CBS 121591 TaxID=1448315 RepID=A0A319C419_9EURO|nr:putative 3-octaprenyl-4-hydroxybenzoate carboxy-lyase [Aspergillus uvarum CBS 121591]PYH78787.1 putative 3-octaprenyl-4-hydroxybenzoate carboxy-lyase [Aspergillus uvarum CBS 121591]